MSDKNTIWYKDWFDSPYYHILYKHRNCEEAELFIDNLINVINPLPDARFLDLGCGKGRHSIYLNKKGFDVTGIDLSSKNIDHAKKHENEKLHFYVHDMKKIIRTNYFDYALNLFTSFGYFENERDNYATVQATFASLKPGGVFIIDFMNVKKVIKNMISRETKIIDGIEFNIRRSIENGFITKDIEFCDKRKEYKFREQVKVLTLNDFEKYLAATGLKILHLWGDYLLKEFDPETSDRLIIVAQKQ